MLSSVLHSERAVEVNIAIMRVFVRLRQLMAAHGKLASRLKELEERLDDHDEQIVAIFEAIRQLMTPPETPEVRVSSGRGADRERAYPAASGTGGPGGTATPAQPSNRGHGHAGGDGIREKPGQTGL